MPKNNSNQSPLDKLAAEMETAQEQAKTQPTSESVLTQETAQEQAGTEQVQTSRYVPAESEKHLYHVQLERPLFDKITGKRISTPYVQKFGKRAFNKFIGKKNEKDKSNAEMLGYTTKVLWNPEENI